MSGPEHVDVLVVGAGQAGLGTAYELGRRAPDLSVLVVDAAPRAGQAWLDRWDSLQLFTPRRFSELPGLRFPRGSTRCPDRVEMAAYLQEYVRVHRLRLRGGTRVERVTGGADGFLVEARAGRPWPGTSWWRPGRSTTGSCHRSPRAWARRSGSCTPTTTAPPTTCPSARWSSSAAATPRRSSRWSWPRCAR